MRPVRCLCAGDGAGVGKGRTVAGEAGRTSSQLLGPGKSARLRSMHSWPTSHRYATCAHAWHAINRCSTHPVCTAGLILENWVQGRHKHLWLSVGADLKIDTNRDLADVGGAWRCAS